MDTILLIGKSNDPHIKGITQELEKNNEKFIILEKFSSSDSFLVKFKNGLMKNYVNIDKTSFSSNSIKSIWNTSALQIDLQEEIKDEARKFANTEWTAGISTLWNSFKVKWINHPDSIICSSNRIKQLEQAESLGLHTPESIVTNNPTELSNFYDQHNGNIIGKTLGSSEGLPRNKMIFTTKITKKDLLRSNSLKYVPTLFQEYVPKLTELRVTIIENTIHAAEIHSQKSVKTKHDWRNYDEFDKTPYVKTELPKEISSKLIELIKIMKLKFGAADLIKTPDGDIIFLEMNPNGRWWWIQELTGMNIAKDIASNLAKV